MGTGQQIKLRDMVVAWAQELDLDSCVGQWYRDGANAVKVDRGGLQKLIRDLHPTAVLIVFLLHWMVQWSILLR